jgi:hypothetical protein
VAAEFTVVGIATAETAVGDAVVAFAAVIFTTIIVMLGWN